MTHDALSCPRCARAAFGLIGMGSLIALVAREAAADRLAHTDVLLAAIFLAMLAIVSLVMQTH